MMLCYGCYIKRNKEDKWDTFDYDINERRKCEDCDLVGRFVREIKEEWLI